TRQSPLTLAAFRPWGSSQDGRRAGSTGESSGVPPDPAHGPPHTAAPPASVRADPARSGPRVPRRPGAPEISGPARVTPRRGAVCHDQSRLGNVLGGGFA